MGTAPTGTDGYRWVQTGARGSRNLAESQAPSSYDARLLHLVRRVAAGGDTGFELYARLSKAWGVTMSEVERMATTAHAVYRSSRGDMGREINRSVATNEWVKRQGKRVLKDARDQVHPVTGMVDLHAQAVALRTVQQAQAAQDKATGVAVGAQMAQVFRTPEFQALLATIHRALGRFPEAREAVLAEVRTELDAKRAGHVFDDTARALELAVLAEG